MARGDNIALRGDPASQYAQLHRDFARIKEKVEKFTGERGEATKPLSAIRRTELRALASIKPQASRITAAPTMDDYNALQADVANILAALALIANTAGTATIPNV